MAGDVQALACPLIKQRRGINYLEKTIGRYRTTIIIKIWRRRSSRFICRDGIDSCAFQIPFFVIRITGEAVCCILFHSQPARLALVCQCNFFCRCRKSVPALSIDFNAVAVSSFLNAAAVLDRRSWTSLLNKNRSRLPRKLRLLYAFGLSF